MSPEFTASVRDSTKSIYTKLNGFDFCEMYLIPCARADAIICAMHGIRKTDRLPVRVPTGVAAICLALVMALGLFAVRAAAGDAPNRALAQGGTQVYVSSSPNPAWTPAQAVDGLLDINHGWIASADNDSQPWIALEFPAPLRVETIVFYQAGLTEAGEKRFARPRRLRIEMDGVEPRTVTLEDRERVPQRLTLEPARTSVIKIDILSTYEDARFPFLTGFQEIEVYEGGLDLDTGAAEPYTPPAIAEPDNDEDNADAVIGEIESTVLRAGQLIEEKNSPAGNSSGGGLDAQERELLLLLREFTAKLEEYMKEN